MLLDLKALAYGRLLFHEIKASRPHIRVAGENEQAMTYVLGLLATTEKTVAKSDIPGWFAPTLAVRHVEIYNGSVGLTRLESAGCIIPLISASTAVVAS